MTKAPDGLAGWLDYITRQHSAEIELGLGRLKRVAQQLQLKPFRCPVITVAGTNGKGSSITALERFYTASGYRTGCYTSPHLTIFNERIRVATCFASDEEICEAFSQIDSLRNDIPLTYFEFATLAAFIIFSISDLDVILLEVGLGGRLDATNIVPADLALITSIGIDHVAWLGKDREAIAVEKAGIIHSGKMAVISDQNPPQSLLSIAKNTAEKVFILNQDYQYGREQAGWWWKTDQKSFANLPMPGLYGDKQFDNLAGVLMCLQALQGQLPISSDIIYATLPEVRLAGRFQVIDGTPQLILDVSHNPDSTALLAQNLQRESFTGKTHAIVAMLNDKDISTSLANLTSCIDCWYLSGLSVSRAAKPELLKATLKSLNPTVNYRIYADVKKAWEAVHKTATNDDRIVVFGSFHTVGAIIDHLKLNK